MMGEIVRWTLLFGLLAISMAAGAANAQSCGANPDDPMVWNEGFGVSSCRETRSRYHINDYEGEAARGYSQSSDPMVWSDDQWRSTLFDGYSHNSDSRYDRRFRREADVAPPVAVEREVEVIVRQDGEASVKPAEHRGWRYVNRRTPPDTKTPNGVLRFDGHGCKGVLVLTWGKLGGKQRCYEGGARRLKVR
jgi:hypothetical protein